MEWSYGEKENEWKGDEREEEFSKMKECEEKKECKESDPRDARVGKEENNGVECRDCSNEMFLS